MRTGASPPAAASWTAFRSLAVGAADAAGAAAVERWVAPLPPPPPVEPPPPEEGAPVDPPPPPELDEKPPPLLGRLSSAARRARLMTSRQAVYWSLSAGSSASAF